MDCQQKIAIVFRGALVWLSAIAASGVLSVSDAQEGRTTYDKTCSACHAKGVGGAPRTDDSAQWRARLGKIGYSGLFDSAIKGKGAMPPKGGNNALSDDQVMSAVMHMLAAASAGTGGQAPASAGNVVKSADGVGARGREVYQATCAACHTAGVAGAPKLGDWPAWSPRLSGGVAVLYASALKGKGAMPVKGGNVNLADTDVKAAVDFMVAQSRGTANAAPGKPEAKRMAAAAGGEERGKSAYQAVCVACHEAGIAGAPKTGDSSAWAPRLKLGSTALYASALNGKGAMPPKGGNSAMPDDNVKAAVDFMLAAVATPVRAGATGRQVNGPAVASDGTQVTASGPSPPVAVSAPGSGGSDVNAFNRLLPAPGKRNLPPLEDGIHDATNDATRLLQTPLQAYAGLPRSNAGNRIDWVKALNEKKVAPRADRQDPKAEMFALELNIVREVKGSMPDVVYPHRQHTQWLDCSNCHPAIFIPQKGANQMSMASIILGQKCGVCHGKVAFPISECRLCHSKAKVPASIPAGGKP